MLLGVPLAIVLLAGGVLAQETGSADPVRALAQPGAWPSAGNGGWLGRRWVGDRSVAVTPAGNGRNKK